MACERRHPFGHREGDLCARTPTPFFTRSRGGLLAARKSTKGNCPHGSQRHRAPDRASPQSASRNHRAAFGARGAHARRRVVLARAVHRPGHLDLVLHHRLDRHRLETTVGANVTGMMPGSSVTEDLVVANAGTQPLRYAMTTVATTPLGAALTLEVRASPWPAAAPASPARSSSRPARRSTAPRSARPSRAASRRPAPGRDHERDAVLPRHAAAEREHDAAGDHVRRHVHVRRRADRQQPVTRTSAAPGPGPPRGSGPDSIGRRVTRRSGPAGPSGDEEDNAMRILGRSTVHVRRFLDVVLIALILVVVFGVILAKVVPLTGRQTIIVGGGSMEPAIRTGSAIVVAPGRRERPPRRRRRLAPRGRRPRAVHPPDHRGRRADRRRLGPDEGRRERAARPDAGAGVRHRGPRPARDPARRLPDRDCCRSRPASCS